MCQKLTVIKERVEPGSRAAWAPGGGPPGYLGWAARVSGTGRLQAFRAVRAWRACLRAHRRQAGIVPAMATAGTPSNQ
jgi:hypothetical protein